MAEVMSIVVAYLFINYLIEVCVKRHNDGRRIL